MNDPRGKPAATSAARGAPSRLLSAARGRIDLLAGLVLVVLTAIAGWGLVVGGTVVGKDTITQFYPWYVYLGESLRSGQIPAWNPSQFAGAPFAGDPLSGWTYLPAMVLFTVLPVGAAAGGYVLFHLLLAGLSTYALARALRMNVAGAMLAAVGYEYTGYLYTRDVCCSAYVGVSAWLPLAILGAEMAIRAGTWGRRWAWWGVSGLALSQILASWLGQGSYYALLALGGYVAYRTLIAPPENVRGAWGRASGLVLHGGAVLLFGFGLAAAGILPRLEFHSLSNLAEGYAGIGPSEAFYGGWELQTWGKLLVPGVVYAGLTTLALALAAPLVARGRHAVPYFFVLSICALMLSGQEVTLLHSVLYGLLPGFEWIHPHGPERVKVVLYLGFALLAGATLSCLGRRRRRSAGALAVLPILTALFLVTRIVPPPPTGRTPEVLAEALGRYQEPFPANLGVGIPPDTVFALVLALSCVVLYALVPRSRPFAAALVVLVVYVDLFAAGSSVIDSRAAADGTDKSLKVDLQEHYAETDASRFLRRQMEDEPVRYFGYGPHLQGNQRRLHYSKWFADADTNALLASNMATPLGLQSIQGYNAIQVGRYVEYIDAVNGETQNYHDADVFPAGLDSPLLDLLGVRYIVVPAVVAPDQGTLRKLKETHPTVYEGDRVDVLENRDALPRAWIVHSARRAEPEEALGMLGSGEVDPRVTALLEVPPPEMDVPEVPGDRASVTVYEANEIEVRTSTDAPGLLVLGEVYYPAWRAYVDGEPVGILRADHLLRAVPIPAGDHTVRLRYESLSLRAGMAISVLTAAALAAALVATLVIGGRRAPRPD